MNSPAGAAQVGRNLPAAFSDLVIDSLFFNPKHEFWDAAKVLTSKQRSANCDSNGYICMLPGLERDPFISGRHELSFSCLLLKEIKQNEAEE